MKNCGKCGISHPLSEFAKHQRSSDGRGSYCKACRRFANREWKLHNREKARANKRASYRRHKSAHAARMKIYRERNRNSIQEQRKAKYWSDPESRREAVRGWRVANPTSVKAMLTEWGKRNPGAKSEMNRRRKLKQKQATPVWIDRKQVRAIYNDAAIISAATGIAHHVDHIVPINSRFVCGLHWEGNLQIVTAAENMRKHNRFEVL